MTPTFEDGLRALEEATLLAKTIRIEMTRDYMELIAKVEALPQNQPGCDKSWVWRLLDSSARFYRNTVRVR